MLTGTAEEGDGGVIAIRGSHTACCQREGEDDVDDGVDGHVTDDSAKTLQTFQLAVTQDGGLGDLSAELEVHDSVETNGSELGEENPDIMSP